MYGTELSHEAISKVIDSVLEEVKLSSDEASNVNGAIITADAADRVDPDQ